MSIGDFMQAEVSRMRAELLAMKQALEAAEAENAELTRKLAEQQAEIDRLMLEHCPDEMTAQQIETWAKHQIPVDAEMQALIDRAAAPQPEMECKSCGGNDEDAPCAYPGENKHGCLRDARMTQPETDIDQAQRLK